MLSSIQCSWIIKPIIKVEPELKPGQSDGSGSGSSQIPRLRAAPALAPKSWLSHRISLSHDLILEPSHFFEPWSYYWTTIFHWAMKIFLSHHISFEPPSYHWATTSLWAIIIYLSHHILFLAPLSFLEPPYHFEPWSYTWATTFLLSHHYLIEPAHLFEPWSYTWATTSLWAILISLSHTSPFFLFFFLFSFFFLWLQAEVSMLWGISLFTGTVRTEINFMQKKVISTALFPNRILKNKNLI